MNSTIIRPVFSLMTPERIDFTEGVTKKYDDRKNFLS